MGEGASKTSLDTHDARRGRHDSCARGAGGGCALPLLSGQQGHTPPGTLPCLLCSPFSTRLHLFLRFFLNTPHYKPLPSLQSPPPAALFNSNIGSRSRSWHTKAKLGSALG